MRRFVAVVLAFAAVIYCAAATYLYVFQRSFVFKPTGELASPANKGLPSVASDTVSMADGTSVTVWHAEPTVQGAPTVLYFHGNSGNISTRTERYREIIDSGYGLYVPTYRGYAGADGQASEAALIGDALEHFDRLSQKTSDIVIHGESLGTGVATALAAKRDAQALILEAPYTATVDIAAESYPWLPVSLLMKDQFLNRERIEEVSEPVLIVHGTKDAVIPFEHGQSLFDRAGDPKTFLSVDGAGHSDLWKMGLWDHAQAFLNVPKS